MYQYFIIFASCKYVSSSVWGGQLNSKRGYQACPWTHKKHPKHIFPGLKFESSNKYSSGIWHPKQVFFFQLYTSNHAIILPLNDL